MRPEDTFDFCLQAVFWGGHSHFKLTLLFIDVSCMYNPRCFVHVKPTKPMWRSCRIYQNLTTHARFPRPFSGCQHLLWLLLWNYLQLRLKLLPYVDSVHHNQSKLASNYISWTLNWATEHLLRVTTSMALWLPFSSSTIQDFQHVWSGWVWATTCTVHDRIGINRNVWCSYRRLIHCLCKLIFRGIALGAYKAQAGMQNGKTNMLNRAEPKVLSPESSCWESQATFYLLWNVCPHCIGVVAQVLFGKAHSVHLILQMLDLQHRGNNRPTF